MRNQNVTHDHVCPPPGPLARRPERTVPQIASVAGIQQPGPAGACKVIESMCRHNAKHHLRVA